ncbi:MAG: hypothetical protein IPP47_13525 [Bryobacterales bacterium]|nr:hypothetical protein [Bryobacterales bacterium]
MNADEQIAYDYLKHLGFEDVVFEPEGRSKSPDFLVGGALVVEARRLNQNWTAPQRGANQEGLETARHRIFPQVEGLLASLGPRAASGSWYVNIRFRRPVPKWRILAALVRQQLQLFQQSPTQKPTKIPLTDNFRIELVRAGRNYPAFFVLGGFSDLDAGGWLIGELERNLEIAIQEKTRKVSHLRSKYQRFWLVLIDHINSGREQVINVAPRVFEKVILVSPLNHTQAFEVTPTPAPAPHP